MAGNKVEYFKDFSNVAEVFDKMLDLGFFVNEEQRDQAVTELPNHHEHWFSNGVVEIKIFRNLFGAYELRNFYESKSSVISELFAVGHLSKS